MPDAFIDKLSDDRLLLVGGGKMGMALLHGWLEAGLDKAQFGIQEPTPSEQLTATGVLLNPEADFEPDIIVLAIKPQLAEAVLPHLAVPSGCLVISLMAGVPTQTIAALMQADIACIRTMPNTPAAIGKGITGLYATEAVGQTERDKAEDLMRAVGDVVWLETEKRINALTAISGSGPAYVFYLTETLSNGAKALGLDEATAHKLAMQTIIGAAAMLQEDGADAAQLRRNVTSPGGTTEAALDVLMGDGSMGELMRRATQAAADRAQELAQPKDEQAD